MFSLSAFEADASPVSGTIPEFPGETAELRGADAEACSRVKVSYTAGAVDVAVIPDIEVLFAEFVVVYSVWNSKSIVVDMLNVVSVSVTLATKVSTISCEAP